jgi:hypothetical protein
MIEFRNASQSSSRNNSTQNNTRIWWNLQVHCIHCLSWDPKYLEKKKCSNQITSIYSCMSLINSPKNKWKPCVSFHTKAVHPWRALWMEAWITKSDYCTIKFTSSSVTACFSLPDSYIQKCTINALRIFYKYLDKVSSYMYEAKQKQKFTYMYM